MTIKELLTLIVTVPILLFLSTLHPSVSVLLFGLWLWGLCFDIYTTYQFYQKEPEQFGVNERNKIFCYFVTKFGFKKAVILFPLTCEIPLLLFFTLLPMQILHTFMFPTTPNNPITCLATSFGTTAIGHLQAAIKNTHQNNKTLQSPVSPKRPNKPKHLTKNKPSNYF